MFVDNSWKENWEESKQRFRKWWSNDGFVVGMWGGIGNTILHEPTSDPGWLTDGEERVRRSEWRAESIHYGMARTSFAGDILPIANCNIAVGSLALFLGGDVSFNNHAAWLEPIYNNVEISDIPSFKIHPENEWLKIADETYSSLKKYSSNKYMMGCQSLCENLDVFTSLRGTEQIMIDMIEEPDWVDLKMKEINQAWFQAYSRFYDYIKLSDGSSSWSDFSIWGEGKTAVLQCDASAMISPNMFERFVLPHLTEQCNWLDHSMFHLDGKECVAHLDYLLSIERLDAIEWSPDPSSPEGSDSYWFPMYKKILDAGKSIQLINIEPKDVHKILDGIGTKGVYILSMPKTLEEYNELTVSLEKYK